jgi:hypothetical protein
VSKACSTSAAQGLTTPVRTARSFGTLPTPSPEINPASVSGLDDGLIDMPTWDAIRSDGSYAAVTGAKRSHDYVVDDFFTDVKKRRVNPAYDPRK